MRIHGGNVWQGSSPEAWLDFSANIRPGGPPAWVRHALATALERTAYYPDPEMRAARKALGAHLGVDQEWVLPTAGGISAINLAAKLPAKGILAFAPCFGEYAHAAAVRGLPFETISLLAGSVEILHPSKALDMRSIENCALWLCSPLNPVGVAFSRGEIERLLAKVEAENAWLVIDEAFIYCCPEWSSIDLLAEHERLLIVGSLTKSLGIPGVRLGYLCAQPGLLRRLETLQSCWELNCFAEAVLLALPEHDVELCQEKRKNEERREALRRTLESMGMVVYPSQANFLLVKFAEPVALIAAELRTKGILVRECMDFDEIGDGQHLRLAVKDELANARLIAELGKILHQ